jgi:hypothetical protein
VRFWNFWPLCSAAAFGKSRASPKAVWSVVCAVKTHSFKPCFLHCRLSPSYTCICRTTLSFLLTPLIPEWRSSLTQRYREGSQRYQRCVFCACGCNVINILRCAVRGPDELGIGYAGAAWREGPISLQISH